MDEQIRQIAERLRGLRDVLELTATISPATATSLQKSTVWPKPENSTSRSACCRR